MRGGEEGLGDKAPPVPSPNTPFLHLKDSEGKYLFSKLLGCLVLPTCFFLVCRPHLLHRFHNQVVRLFKHLLVLSD